mgnify:CR=1 FL=1
MLINIVFSIFKMSLKNQYSHRTSHFLEILSIIISMFVYFYISKAFSSSVEGELSAYGGDYFSYVVFGEIFLMLPLHFLDSPYRKIRSSIVEGTFETYLSLPISTNRLVLLLSSWNLVQVLKRILLTLLIACIFFGLRIPFSSLVQLILLQIVSSFAFLGLGLCVSCSILFFGRGGSLLGYLNTIISISAGSFFPISVLPSWLSNSSRILSPFTLLLENTRSIIIAPLEFKQFIIVFSILLGWGIFFFLGRVLLDRGIEFYRRSGKLSIISHY